MPYSPVLHVASSYWMVGWIHGHTARPLTREEADNACRMLEAMPALVNAAHFLERKLTENLDQWSDAGLSIKDIEDVRSAIASIRKQEMPTPA